MQEAIQKADVLIEALNWIRRFRDKVTVIKLGGSLLEDEESLRHILIDVIFMETVGMRPVIVHGGGAAISAAMSTAGIQPHFIQGRRYTDRQTLDIVEKVLAFDTCEALAKQLGDFGGRAEPLNFRTTNVLRGKRVELRCEADQPVDLGFVGRVTQVDTTTLHKLLLDGVIPVIPSMCADELSGDKLNVNADTAATTVAQQLGAEKLIYLSDVNGVRTDKDDPDTLVHAIDDRQAREMIKSGQVDAGMIPKIEACLETLEQGVRKVHIIDGQLRHSLLLEIYTTQGVGTVISKKR